MDVVIQGLPFAKACMDDIVAASANKSEHFDQLQQVFAGLEKHDAKNTNFQTEVLDRRYCFL